MWQTINQAGARVLVTADDVPECTSPQAREWTERYSEGYRTGRGDARWGASPRVPLVDVPAEHPSETGARYVTRNLPIAWEIGYTRAYTYETGR